MNKIKILIICAAAGVLLAGVSYAQDYSTQIQELLNRAMDEYETTDPAQPQQPIMPQQFQQPQPSMPQQQLQQPTMQYNPPISDPGPTQIDEVRFSNDEGSSSTTTANAKKKDTKIDVLELKNMSIQDFLKLIAQKSGLNIVAGANVQGKITIYLKDVYVRDALRIILEANNLAFVEEGNIIKVMTAQEYELKLGHKFGDKFQTKIIKLKHANVLDMVTVLNQMKSPTGKVIFDTKSNTLVLMDSPRKIAEMEDLVEQVDVPIGTEIFDLSYADAKEIGEKLNEYLTINVGKVKYDERSNRIVVTDTIAKMDEIRRFITAFDVREEEVLIEARIVQIVLSDEHDMGVDWEAIVSDYHDLNLTGNITRFAEGDRKGTLSIGTLSSDDYTFLLEALETVGETNILSSPSITTLNNTEAKILVGSTQPYVTTTTTTPSTGPATTAESVNFIDVGVKLYVTPKIHHDGFITMKIKPEVSSVTSNITTSNNNTIPVVETSEAETVVTVKNNVTIVIGGLIKEEKVDSVKKIPLLGDLPFLGVAFRNADLLERKTELVIFLTPKIITGDVDEYEKIQQIREGY